MKTIKALTTFSLLIGGTMMLHAQNPYLPLWEFIPDGEPYVFEDPDQPGEYRVYIYGSHDDLKTQYCGRDQVVWSASVNDLRNWRYDGEILKVTRDRDGKPLSLDGQGDVLYAPDVTMTTDASGKKTYYLFPNDQHGGRNGLVAKSDRPDGPFEVINWSKDNPTETNGVLRFDPAVFVDDDNRVYGYWGFEHSSAAELDPFTMATIKPGCEEITLVPGRYDDDTFRFFEASSMRKIKDKYVFIYSRWTRDGEFGLPETNYTLAYAYSNNPLGPFTYGGTIIDGRARETRANGTVVPTATPNGNTHGSICEINGKWYVFYHRQCGTTEYSRQAMVAPIEVEVKEGADGYVKISEAEYTSEGFQTDGLNPYETYPAGIACYYTHTKPAHQEYPHVIYYGSHPQNIYHDYLGQKNPYDLSINQCPMVNNTPGSVFGYKYFNLNKTNGKASLQLVLGYTAEGVNGAMDVYLDRPTTAEGGKKLGTIKLSGKKGETKTASLDVTSLTQETGKHALFFVINSGAKGKSVAQFDTIRFE